MTALTKTDADRLVELPVAERPLIRELAEWRTLLPFAGRVLALQGTHPLIAKGIYDHSTLFIDPIARAQNTLDYAQRMLFGTDRASTATEIRDLHTDIKGTGFDGRPYHAWNREAWTWVHLTTFDSFRYALRATHIRVPEHQVDDLYAQWRATGALYGVREQDMPADVDGLRDYIRDGVETKLTHQPDQNLLFEAAKPDQVPLPRPVWNLLLRVSRRPIEVLLFGPWPSTLRERNGVRWSPVHEVEYRAVLGVLRTVPAVLPDRLRMLPYAYQALYSEE